MKYYELTYLAKPDLSEENLNGLQRKITSFLQDGSGVLNELKNPIKKTLAYTIKKQKAAFLVTLGFYGEGGKICDFEKKLKSEPEILRYLIVSKKEQTLAATSEMEPARGRREDWISKKFKKVPSEIKKPTEPKVELKEIEKKLEEILGE
ncbi:MAG: 30S ribosomal protein S6 [Candidatus Nealsonbacteria bacterium CG_4_9_14_0_2_um_filter_37_38]|uniref:Small ribosomal subunit protein bS6 n=1 Tax=Candidatus Nealsonbacteria bacterium CG_4_10_14_0_8_um_filter_37_14 TaxID=1974684 RepID=A0A2M7R6G5_9BACT|nr:MAG: 30S ribosomal protein S6 [Candidatus Nealsonbacteria bacterium CG11_big_fil_rev_8_21_14_0_20_37_68]PIW91864.1 MAG: 30S ribosomal protein S6 [Candidatus Nealsonbacteria bacterium CG_4_8_14_3_um_filter_37_23]PIY89202.1 MAG: 30S ribosomal protein S6 [Candidatus Nealsonbacteria bacterium CG_4_10_14_0_8_um_filter_37_14]PJC51606.1 MAG: 30S ribosomal protein S6 [Candidatus Nealsonbacteria bacterium CG_4_9_14_0_2_um_filter_37_38]